MTEWTRPRWRHGHWVYWFYESVYRENIYLIWPVTPEQRAAFIKRQFGIDNLDHERGVVWGGRTSEVLDSDNVPFGHMIALCADWKPDAKGMSMLAHEVFHIVAGILTRRGVKFDNEVDSDNEAFAYLIERVFKSCYAATTAKPIKASKPKKRRK